MALLCVSLFNSNLSLDIFRAWFLLFFLLDNLFVTLSSLIYFLTLYFLYFSFILTQIFLKFLFICSFLFSSFLSLSFYPSFYSIFLRTLRISILIYFDPYLYISFITFNLASPFYLFSFSFLLSDICFFPW